MVEGVTACNTRRERRPSSWNVPLLLEEECGHVEVLNMPNPTRHAAAVAAPSSRTATLVMPFPAASVAMPTGKRPVPDTLMFLAVLSHATCPPMGGICAGSPKNKTAEWTIVHAFDGLELFT